MTSCALEYGHWRHCIRQVPGNVEDITMLIREREDRGFQLVAFQRFEIKGASFDSWYLVFKRLVTIDNINSTDWE